MKEHSESPLDKEVSVTVDDRELATILGALRFHQAENLQGSSDIPDQAIRDIASDCGRLKPLSFDEVEGLCERINLDPKPRHTAEARTNGGQQDLGASSISIVGGGVAKAAPLGLHIAPPPGDPGVKPLFRIVYAIDIDASCPCEAARKTCEMMRDPASMPPILDVLDHCGNVTRVDLCETAEANPDAGKTNAGENHPGNEPVVIIAVSGGVADVLFKPMGVGVSIFDYDVEGEDAPSTDPDGKPCCVGEWPASEKTAFNKHWTIIKEAMRIAGRSYSRKWECPACKRTTTCSYEELAAVGSPYCVECDVEMRLD